MTESVEIPEEALEAAVNGHPESWRETIEEAVERAAPFIRAQEHQRLQEALSEPIHTLASTIGRARCDFSEAFIAQELATAEEALGRLRTALDTLEKPHVS